MSRFALLVRKAHAFRLVRFLAAGAINTLFGYLVYLAGLLVGMMPELALLTATVAGALFNYVTTARYVFGHRSLSRLPAFVASYAVVYGINAFAVRSLLTAGFPPEMAQALLVPAMAILSFFLFRILVFRQVETL